MIILIGASASGKTEIVKELIRDYGYKKLVTYTSRGMRINEVEGQDYHFIQKDDFENRIKNNFFFEYIEYNGNYYGTAIEDIEDMKVVILEPNGFKAYHNSSLKNIVSFYLDSTEEKRIERMKFRRDDINKIYQRIEIDRESFDYKKIEGLDYIMNSNDLTISELSKEIDEIYRKKIGLNK